MEVILLERIAKLGQMGDVVRVKPGFARNFLLPQGKALRANKANLERFERDKVQLEARNLERKQEAEAVAEKLEGQTFVAIRSAGDTGQLYGSVSSRDIVETLTAGGFTILRNQVALIQPIKTLGLHDTTISLHPEVQVNVTINVARSEEEAERQARGEDVTVVEDEFDEDEAAPALDELMEDEEVAAQAAAELAADAAEMEAEDESGAAAGQAENAGDADAAEEEAGEDASEGEAGDEKA